MSKLPKLSLNEVLVLTSENPSWTRYPESMIIRLLFEDGSGYSSSDSLHERLSAYTDHQRSNPEIITALVGLIPDLLQYFREKQILTEDEYHFEYSNCKVILSRLLVPHPKTSPKS